MTQSEQLTKLSAMTGETTQSTLLTYLELAGEKILQKLYPFRSEVEVVPDKFRGLQVEIACYLLNKRGAEGELSHSENGINRSYENASVPSSMLSSVVPYVGVM